MAFAVLHTFLPLLLFSTIVQQATSKEIHCEDTSDCPDGKYCCSCVCHENHYPIGDFSCNCDKHGKPLGHDQPDCCGGIYGFKSWCFKNKTAPHKLQCSNQTLTGVPTPAEDYYPFGQFYRCVDGCNLELCDSPTMKFDTCHAKTPSPSPSPKPHPPSPSPTPPPPSPAPSGNCNQKNDRPLGCPCTHKWDCADGLICVDLKCTKQNVFVN